MMNSSQGLLMTAQARLGILLVLSRRISLKELSFVCSMGDGPKTEIEALHLIFNRNQAMGYTLKKTIMVQVDQAKIRFETITATPTYGYKGRMQTFMELARSVPA